jgi:hypothetical protein
MLMIVQKNLKIFQHTCRKMKRRDVVMKRGRNIKIRKKI